MTWKIPALLSAAALLCHCRAPSGTQYLTGETQYLEDKPAQPPQLFAPPAPESVPADAADLNDTARFLAGMEPLGRRNAFEELRDTPRWKNHAARMNGLWHGFTQRHARLVSSWARSEIGDLRGARAVFYPFSGPDFAFAHVIYPQADTYLLCGLESCEPLPQWNTLAQDEVGDGCDGLHDGLDTALQFSYFITKEMRADFQATRFRGVLPVLLVFLARTGHVVEQVEHVRLDADGPPVRPAPAGSGLHIRFNGRGGVKHLFYFTQNLADDACKPGGPFLRFAASLGRPAALAKSASYLMHGGGFDHVRDFILTQCRGIVQDPSGVPFRSFKEKGWRVSLYGNYLGTYDPFEEYPQPDLIRAYQAGGHDIPTIPFGIGYLTNPRTTCLMVGRP